MRYAALQSQKAVTSHLKSEPVTAFWWYSSGTLGRRRAEQLRSNVLQCGQRGQCAHGNGSVDEALPNRQWFLVGCAA